ncbi:hypothetical protein [Rheinheimera gaetbuli]
MSNKTEAEWLSLQRSFSQYDTQALWLKLITITACLYLLHTGSSLNLQLASIALFWLHEAMLRTVQHRTAIRLLQLEQALAQHADAGMQWHSQWQQNRGGSLALASDYLRQTLKPTVALTHLLLLALCFFTAIYR